MNIQMCFISSERDPTAVKCGSQRLCTLYMHIHRTPLCLFLQNWKKNICWSYERWLQFCSSILLQQLYGWLQTGSPDVVVYYCTKIWILEVLKPVPSSVKCHFSIIRSIGIGCALIISPYCFQKVTAYCVH